MANSSVTVRACANIAFIKYWGNRPEGGNLPLNPSISMTLDSCVTTTRLSLLPGAERDEIILGGRTPDEKSVTRIVRFLDMLRQVARRKERARVDSANSFPTGCGIASSASGFAALAAAGAAAYGLNADAAELSRLARLGSGSAARSVMGGFVELHRGTHEESFAEQLAPEAHWPELRDVVAILSGSEKAVSSADGHGLARTSEMCAGRLDAVPARAARVREAIRRRDLEQLGAASEEDALSMHAVMMTSHPPLLYWDARTIDAIRLAWELRRKGTPAWFTIDAGPNVHFLTTAGHVAAVEKAIRETLGAQTLSAAPGPDASVVERAM